MYGGKSWDGSCDEPFIEPGGGSGADLRAKHRYSLRSDADIERFLGFCAKLCDNGLDLRKECISNLERIAGLNGCERAGKRRGKCTDRNGRGRGNRPEILDDGGTDEREQPARAIIHIQQHGGPRLFYVFPQEHKEITIFLDERCRRYRSRSGALSGTCHLHRRQSNVAGGESCGCTQRLSRLNNRVR